MKESEHIKQIEYYLKEMKSDQIKLLMIREEVKKWFDSLPESSFIKKCQDK